jgi:ABC-type transport system involved in Fe-S cluster assembly fused permease/ATPase subunit
VVPFLHTNPIITRKIITSYVYLVLSKICFFGGPLLLKGGINAIQSTAAFDPSLLFLGYGLCYTGSILFESLRNIKVIQVSNEAIKDISQQAYMHVLKLEPEFFFGSSQRQTLFKLSRALTAIEQNLRTLNQFLVPMFVDIVTSSILIYAYFGTGYVCTFLGSFALYSIFTIKYSDYRRAGVKLQKNTEKEVDFMMSEIFSNYYNVKYYSAENFESIRYLEKLQANYKHTMINQNSLGILNTGQRLLFATGMTINMMVAAQYAKRSLMSAGDIVMMQSLMLQLINPLFFLGTMYRNFTDSFIDIKELFRVLQTPPKIRDPETPIPCGDLFGKIEFRDISFRYDNQPTMTLEKLSFTIQPGEFVALMGPSGIGKSTIFKLLFRLYDPQSG